MTIAIIQMILIILLAFFMTIDQNGFVVITYFPVIVGFIVGLIMGDMKTAMIVAGTFQLMALGVASLGGSSVPNYGLATIVGAYIAIKTGQGIKAGLAIGLPVGMLGIQLDIIVKLVNNFIVHKAQAYANNRQFGKMKNILYLGPVLFGLSTAIPTAICVIFGSQAVSFILNSVPSWVTNGLSIAGGILPVVGIAILLHYMPVKKYLMYILIGFALSAFLKMPILGVAIIGFGFAYNMFTKAATAPVNNTAVQGDDYDE
ncbi:MAG: PTS sugar transporter subunit IIC [Clostridium sp.]|uniref:PTS mannose/fructose/sorbose/N-acetylgalactosamine transporter subunit IIC n=1 Tax=Clostridium sp. TaxID=1506 RepID=UPI0039EA63F3